MKNKIDNKYNESEEGFEVGVVEKIEGVYALVRLQEHEACEHCHAKIICKPNQSGQRQVKLKNTVGAAPGDKVVLASSDLKHVTLSFMQYGFPLLGFLAGLIISYQTIDKFPLGLSQQFGSFFVGLIFLGLFSLGTYIWSKKMNKNNFSVLQISKIIKPDH
ncbi:MAG: SoxR reducing system RseC family protein [Candidatus Marinimicrobia bacterium]|nr:SoxR reducing system RseC family protein [Candidatus Neomarinimicrobiota bacterium]